MIARSAASAVVRCDVAVVGLGAMGSAALYHLAQRGASVVGLERYSSPHDKGSSHGQTRIIRLAYNEGADYVPLLHRAYELWHDLERHQSQKLLHKTGSLDAMRAFDGALASARQHGLRHDVLRGADVNARFPGYNLPDDCQALYQPDGGYLLSEQCIAAHLQAARRLGAVVRQNEEVVTWRVLHDGVVELQTPQQTLHAQQIVLSVGAWASCLVPELQGLLVPERQVVGWFEVSDENHLRAPDCPVFIIMDGTADYYGFPAADDAGFKIGKYHHLKQAVNNPDDVDRAVHADDEAALRRALSLYFPSANGSMTRSSVCMFTNTPDNDFIIDRHPCHPQVWLCSPCSGHGFKFSSVIGEIMADLVINDGATQHNIARHRIQPSRVGHAAFLKRCRDGASRV